MKSEAYLVAIEELLREVIKFNMDNDVQQDPYKLKLRDENLSSRGFEAKIVKFGDTFKSDGTKPIYGLLFTAESDQYLLRELERASLSPGTRVFISIKKLGESE